jgi:hypothetical protein
MKTFLGYETQHDFWPMPDEDSRVLQRSRGRPIHYAYTVEDGEVLQNSFPISPDEGDRARLIDPDETIVASGKARLVMDGHLDRPVYRVLGDDDMTRGQLMDAICETFHEIQRMEDVSKVDDVYMDGSGVFGLEGRHIPSFFLEGITLHRIDGQTWITIETGT